MQSLNSREFFSIVWDSIIEKDYAGISIEIKSSKALYGKHLT